MRICYLVLDARGDVLVSKCYTSGRNQAECARKVRERFSEPVYLIAHEIESAGERLPLR